MTKLVIDSRKERPTLALSWGRHLVSGDVDI